MLDDEQLSSLACPQHGRLKWKRPEPGLYVSGDWTIEGSGTTWYLYLKDKVIATCPSKKDCQKVAEDPPKPKKKPPPVKAAKPAASSPELDSVLASLRLEIDQLALRVSSLDDAIRKSTEGQEGLTKAVLLLGRHVGKLAK